MKVVKKVLSMVCKVASVVLHGAAVACDYVSQKLKAASDKLNQE